MADRSPALPAKTDGKPGKTPESIMYDALTNIAHSDAFFDETKRVVAIARKAIEAVHNTYRR